MADTTASTGLMPHQKDEFDVWTCKDCGWKYPNAKPSSKVRKHHKKQCRGKNGADPHTHGGGSSDEALSDDEHHHTPGKGAEAAPAPAVESASRDFDFAAAASEKDDISAEAGGATRREEPNKSEEGEKEVAVADKSNGLMPHQRDEFDIWICKQCGWKYPNAKPSSKVRKHHKKVCPGKGGAGTGAGAGGSSDEASDDEHHPHHHHVEPERTPPLGGEESIPPAEAPSVEAPSVTSKEIDLEEKKPEVEAPTVTSKEIDFEEKKPEVEAPPVTSKEIDFEKKPEDDVTVPDAPPSGCCGTAEEKGVSFKDAVAKESEHEREAGAASGLMRHQKDETDVWVCKQCGWKYPNAKPSPKIRKNHKKKCPGSSTGAVPGGESSDEASDDDHHSAAAAKSTSGGAVATASDEAKVPETEIASRDFVPEVKAPGTEPSFASVAALPGKEEEEPTDGSATKEAGETVSGGLMPHQKDDKDIWVCKDCGWKYPNAKPSAKIRKHHKAKCPGKDKKRKEGGSSDDASSGDEKLTKASQAGAA